jgi:Ca-activated chloride channel family protein
MARLMKLPRPWSAAVFAISFASLLIFMTRPPVAESAPLQANPIRTGLNGRLALDPPPLETDLQLLTVSVTSKGNAVPGLSQDRFQVLEDGVEQKISYFWVDSRPLTIGFLMDASSNMSDAMAEAIRGAGQAFLKNKLPEDEYFVINFSDLPSMVVSYTMDAKLMPHVYPMIGESPLYDAIYLGLDAIKEAANPRHILLVITAGANNAKGVTDDQLVNYAIKQPVQIYSLLFGGSSSAASESANVLDLLAGVSGGRASLATDSSFAVEALCSELAQALKTQYLIGFKSTNAARDGKRRGVKVKVNTAAGSPKLSVWTQSGYYAPKESKNKATVKPK